jgi:hypothetical protein
MTEKQFASAVVRIWRLRQRIAKGGTEKQLASAFGKLWDLVMRIALQGLFEEPHR